MTEEHANILNTIICEFKNISPEITETFMFKADGEVVASDKIATEEQIKNLIDAFNGISSKAEIIGGIENVTLQGADRQLSITSINNRYLVAVSSREANEKIIKSLTGVIVPSVVNLVDELTSKVPEPQSPPQIIEPEIKPIEETILPVQDEPLLTESLPEEPVTFHSEPSLPEPPVTQFMIEKIGGLLVASDTVRLNSEVVAKWNNLYDNKQITKIHIETLEGKTTTCKFKSVKEANINAQGIIQIPEKILQTLHTSKGKLVIVKPVIT